jgi:hypothetical protein
LSAAGASYVWWSRKDHYVTFTTNPTSPATDDGVVRRRDEDLFSESAAPLKQLQNGHQRYRAFPHRCGRMNGQRQTRFTPANDWPVDGAFTVLHRKELLASQIELEGSRSRSEADRSTPPSRTVVLSGPGRSI